MVWCIDNVLTTYIPNLHNYKNYNSINSRDSIGTVIMHVPLCQNITMNAKKKITAVTYIISRTLSLLTNLATIWTKRLEKRVHHLWTCRKSRRIYLR